jgi:hypothetical protein
VFERVASKVVLGALDGFNGTAHSSALLCVRDNVQDDYHARVATAHRTHLIRRPTSDCLLIEYLCTSSSRVATIGIHVPVSQRSESRVRW